MTGGKAAERASLRAGANLRRPRRVAHEGGGGDEAEAEGRKGGKGGWTGSHRGGVGAAFAVEGVGELLRRAEAVGGELLQRGQDRVFDAGLTVGRLAAAAAAVSVSTFATMACELGPVKGGSPASIS